MNSRKEYQITAWCQRMIQSHVEAGSLCIDATMGNGNDTEYLCRLVGAEGKVLAFDIQHQALDHTRTRLEEQLKLRNYQLILDSHSHMNSYAEAEAVSCITFNLGYLPGGDHQIATRTDTTIEALEQALVLLKKDGLLSICIYSGGDSGFEEKEAVLSWLRTLNPRQYLVLVTEYYNRPNHPPIPAMVIKL